MTDQKGKVMFTGIIEEIGIIRKINRGNRNMRMEIEAVRVQDGTQVGDSIAVNGVCLTVTSVGKESFEADVMPETVSRTNLVGLKSGDCVNLERALRPDSRLGGHIVAGHVDGTGRIVAQTGDGNAVWITVEAEREILRYIVMKGSVAVDGVSLTVAYVDDSLFKVSVIPHTQNETTLTSKRIGERVNIENDMIAKYVEKLLKPVKAEGLSVEFLKSCGF